MGKMISEHPYMFAAFVVVLLAAIAGVIYGVVTKGGWKDRGQIIKEGKALHWNRKLVPIPVLVMPGLKEAYVEVWNRTAAALEEVVGRPVFMPPSRVSADFNPNGTMYAVVLNGDANAAPNRGDANLWWDMLTGEIIRAYVVFPDAHAELPDADVIVLHEACHVLGLDHDEGKHSIMHPEVQYGSIKQALTKRDVALLQQLYKEGD